MPQQQGKILVHGQGEVEVELISAYLVGLKHAYDSVLVFESVIDGLKRASREFPWHPLGMHYGWPLGPRRAVRYVRDWPPDLPPKN
jgi:hypothetical protein